MGFCVGCGELRSVSTTTLRQCYDRGPFRLAHFGGVGFISVRPVVLARHEPRNALSGTSRVCPLDPSALPAGGLAAPTALPARSAWRGSPTGAPSRQAESGTARSPWNWTRAAGCGRVGDRQGGATEESGGSRKYRDSATDHLQARGGRSEE